MGAKNCPETPRQQMIGMMYLVLTAMLALNVSKDILAAFDVVDNTLNQSNINVKEAMTSQYTALYNSEDAKAEKAKEKAKKLKKLTDETVNYIEQLRFDMTKYVDGEKADGVQKAIANAKKESWPIPIVPVEDIEGKDNFDKPTFFMLGDSEGKDPKCNAHQLKMKIEAYKKNALALIENEALRKEAERKIQLSTADHKKDPTKKGDENKSWEVYNFDHLITGGAVILLSKMAGEVKNAENEIFQALISEITASDFKIAEFEGHAIAESKVLFVGDKYKANVVIAAFDPSIDLDVYYKVGADSLPISQESSAQHLTGKGSGVPLELDGGGTGEHKFAGFIKIVAPDGKGDGDGYKRFFFHDNYMVIPKSGATVSADKMNVLYAGIVNPMTAAGGMDASKISLSIPGCTVAGAGGGHYNVTPPVGLVGKTVTATVRTSEGSVNQTFRVKKVPDPTSYLGGGIWGGKRSKGELLAQPFISARMGDDFAFDLRWSITSYTVTVISKGIEGAPMSCSGGQFSGAVSAAISGASSGTVIIFSNIKATSAAGTRTLRDITVRIR